MDVAALLALDPQAAPRQGRRQLGSASMTRFLREKLILAGAIAVGVASLPAHAANLVEKNFWLSGPNYDAHLPMCDDPAVQGKIRAKFAHKEAEYWNSNLTIETIERTREIGFRSWGEEFIPRRFCSARTITSDGRKRGLYYSIVEDQGIIGATWGVVWCVTGADRNNAYAPDCKMARP